MELLQKPQEISAFKSILIDHDIPDTQKVGFRLAVYDSRKKKYVNTCHRVTVELKAIQRIRPVISNGKKIFKISLLDINQLESLGLEKVSELHGNKEFKSRLNFSGNSVEALNTLETLHDKKDFLLRQSGISDYTRLHNSAKGNFSDHDNARSATQSNLNFSSEICNVNAVTRGENLNFSLEIESENDPHGNELGRSLESKSSGKRFSGRNLFTYEDITKKILRGEPSFKTKFLN